MSKLDDIFYNLTRSLGNTIDPVKQRNSLFGGQGRTRSRVGEYAASKIYRQPIQSPLQNQGLLPQRVEGYLRANPLQGQKPLPVSTKGLTFPQQPSPSPIPQQQQSTITPTPTTAPDKAAQPYMATIQSAAAKNGVPQELLYNLLRQESGFAPDVIDGSRVSSAGALGIAQFMPATAKGRGVNPLDPNSAINGAAKYLKDNYDQFGSWPLALAAYNAGGGAVGKYGGIPPFPETQNYVKSIMGSLGNSAFKSQRRNR